MTVTVCEARPADVSTLAAVYRRAYVENCRLESPARAESATVETVREWIREYRVYVAVAGGTVVGGVRLARTDDGAKLSRLGVHPDRQGEGIGGRLLARGGDRPGVGMYGRPPDDPARASHSAGVLPRAATRRWNRTRWRTATTTRW